MIEPASVLLLSFLIDIFIGEPPVEIHPVCWMGRVVNFLWERRPSRGLFKYGFFLVLAGILLFGAMGWLVSSLWWPVGFVFSVLLLKGTMAAGALVDAGKGVGIALESGNLPLARKRLSWHLVSRNTRKLSSSEIAGGAIESMAENLSDGWVGPLMAFSLLGIPGALVYRFVNTCDSMLGYRYGDFELGGKVAARMDDLFNLIPARISSLLIVIAAGFVGLDWKGSAICAWREHRSTESPNAGWPMAAMAGSLGVILSKRGVYEIRGGSALPAASDLASAIRITRISQIFSVLLAIAVLAMRSFF